MCGCVRVCVHVRHKVAVNELLISPTISAAESSNCILNAKLFALLTLFIALTSCFYVVAIIVIVVIAIS